MIYSKRQLRKNRIFKQYSIPTILTNGQVYQVSSLLKPIALTGADSYMLSNDFFSNKLWKTIDTPKIVLSLIRFDRKYLRGSV